VVRRVAHFLNRWIRVSAFALALRRTSLGRLPGWSMAVGFGAATEILWELGESTVMKLGSSGLQLTYIGDLALGETGTVLGATIVAAGTVAAWPKSPPSPARTKSSARTARRRSRPS
jgi:hypothetical protein